MLVLTRKAGETIRIGDSIELKINQIQGNRVRIAIDAPKEISVIRGELAEKLELEVSRANLSQQKESSHSIKTFAC